MSDFINKVITVILIFIMLVLGPLLISYLSTDMVTERLVLNEVTQFIDKVTDKAAITQYDLDDLYLGVNAHGGSFNVTVSEYIAASEPLPDGSTRTIYIKRNMEEDMEKSSIKTVDLNVGDVVKVTVEEVAMSSGKRLLWTLLHVDKGYFEFSMAGSVG